ncbi:hypothetical protein GALMADRAFT_227535 [Galerina marginata CBS 339.88]|uniref:O-acyltransferase WSD1 C-terminal domain-containing protein n=1 Tax=Galerina marginata (strain CBS 339.88) TaxID=685588 RepID=A0A067SUE7_GALM3|nr:hypothetical protein GALMADRAFT_227535 [Galerina marginata CBS 339.88]
MTMDDGATAAGFALVPLTVFDKLFERTTFVTGWLVEGKVDASALATALDRVTQKWRMLSGRLQSVKERNGVKWMLKIPLGPLPPDYPTYSLTISTSSVPLSKYVPIPLPTVSLSPPPSIFLHASTPRQYTAWESTNHPLTCWQLTYFPASQNGGVDYTCIGFARSHGIFDGGGAAQIMNALVAEMNGREWMIPPRLVEGMNVNLLEEVLARESLVENPSKNDEGHVGYTTINLAGFLKLVAGHLIERFWSGAERRIVLMPKTVLNLLVQEVLRGEQKDVERVTTGDILVAWIFKTVYSTGTNSNAMVHCSNLASFRALLATEIPEALTFPHNVFVPLAYPVLPVAEVNAMSLTALTELFAASRASLSLDHVLAARELLQNPCFPNPPNADETMMVSNVSASRILESDWSAVGSKRTICSYRYQATPTGVMFTNAVYISGRLGDKSVVLDVTLNKMKIELLLREIRRLEAEVGKN